MNSDLFSRLLAKDKEHLPKKESHGWIQWKGTEVCIDIHCKCGYLGHFDGDFFYWYKCRKCGRYYSVGQNVVLHEITSKEDIKYVTEEHVGFKSDKLEIE